MFLKQEKENGVDRLRICKIGKETTITSRVRGQENTNAVENPVLKPPCRVQEEPNFDRQAEAPFLLT